jgi:predicted alpha/beta-hydrolase family hydrolase
MPTQSSPQVFTDVTVDPFVRGFLHRPFESTGKGIVLTHGAGGNCQAPLLIALAESFVGAGFLVLRCDLAFRQDRPYGPPSPHDGKRDRSGLTNAVAAIENLVSGPVYLGGHSYGGRQASMLCAEQPDGKQRVPCLLLMSYPLHPPRKPEQLRTQHFFHLHTPALFVQGVRDPFGSIDEVGQALQLIPARTKLMTVESAGHDLGFKGKNKRTELSAQIVETFQNFM